MLKALLLLACCTGCAARPVRQISERPKFWQSCEEERPAVKDGFQHFLCTDTHGWQYEVQIKKKEDK